MTVSFETTPQERKQIVAIVNRAGGLGLKVDSKTSAMDLAATHANGTPMDFERMLAADDLNFLYDFVGIAEHINRETGALDDFFRPRFAKAT